MAVVRTYRAWFDSRPAHEYWTMDRDEETEQEYKENLIAELQQFCNEHGEEMPQRIDVKIYEEEI